MVKLQILLSSRALHPIEDAYFHQSPLKGKQDYGHRAVAVMFSSNSIVLNQYLCRKRISYRWCLKTNRLLYLFGIKKKLSEFAALLFVTHLDFNLVTIKNQNYYVYRYEGKLNGIENTVVLLSYQEKAFGKPKALRAFLSTGALYMLCGIIR